MKKLILYAFLALFFLILGSKNTFAAVHTFDWNGSTAVLGAYPWELAANWTETGGTGDIPGSASTDIVRFGTNVTFTNQPTLTLVNVTVASITIGSTVSTSTSTINVNGTNVPYYIFNPLTLTITGVGVTLTAGTISVNHAPGAPANDLSLFQTTFTGTGNIVCTGNFAVGNTTASPQGLSANVTYISSTIAHMTIDGNLIFNACGNGSNALCYPYFSLDANKLTLLGQMQYTGTNSPLNEYAGDINSNYHNSAGYCMDTYTTPTTLELQNANGVATNALFQVDFTNGGNAATVLYDDPVNTDVQTVYTSNSVALGTLPYNYSSLYFAGASTKQLDGGGALTIGTEWNSGGTGTVDLTNNPTITDGGNWDNSTNVTHGSGAITVGGSVTNATGTISLSTGALTIGGNLTINSGTIKGSTSTGTTTVGGTLTNSSSLTSIGTLTGNAENWTFGSGVNKTTITAGSGTMTFGGTYQNNSPGTFTAGTGTITFKGNYTANSGSSFTGSSGNVLFSANYSNAGTFTASSGNTYYTGKYTNTGTYKAGSGMVYFNGSGQALSDNSTAGTVFNNVTLNGSGTATISSGTGNFAISSIGSLYMVSPAKLTAGTTTVGGAGYLTIKSDSTSTATVYTPSGTSIKGNVNVQRYISGGTKATRGYRLVSSPVNVSLSTAGAGNLGLSYLNTNATFGGTTYYGGFTEGPGTGFTTNGSTNPIIYLYDESRPTDNSSFVAGKNIGIYSITNATGATPYSVTTIGGTPPVTTAGVSVPVGNSYLWYFVGSNQSTSVVSTRVPDATTLTATGYLNQGTSVPVKFWKSGTTTVPYDITTGTTAYGINQIGNPYAGTINLDTLYTDNYNSSTNPITAVFYELLPGGNYISYNGSNNHTSDSRASRYIVSGQGFLMQAFSASPAETITFKEDQKVAYPASFSSATTPKMMLDVNPATAGNILHKHTDALSPNAPQISTGNNSGLHLQMTLDSTNYAQTGIYYSNPVSDKYVPSEDALQIDGGTPQVYLSSYSSDNVKLSINTMADYGLSKRVRLYANAVYAGAYTLSLADISDVDTTDYNIFLIDNKMQDSIDIVHSKTYSFNLNTADTTTFGANRFVLAIDHKPIPIYMLTTFTGQKVTTGVRLNWTAINAGNYTGYTLQKLNVNGGYDSLYAVQSDPSVTAYNFIDTHPMAGGNTYRLKQNGFTGAITYSATVTVGYNSATPDGPLTLYPNPAKNMMNVSLNLKDPSIPAYVADIYNSAGARVSHRTVSGSSWTYDVSSYKLGVYAMQITDTTGKIIGQAKFMKVE